MAVRAKLSQADAAAGLDFLLVVGIKDSPNKSTRAAHGSFQRSSLHRRTQASFRKAHLQTTLRMRHQALARTIPVTKPAISPNAKSRQLKLLTDPTPIYLRKRLD